MHFLIELSKMLLCIIFSICLLSFVEINIFMIRIDYSQSNELQ